MSHHSVWSVFACALCFSSALLAAEPPQVERFLIQGQLADGEKQLIGFLKEHPEDAQVRFELGTLQFLRAIEHLGQSLYKYGSGGSTSRLIQQAPFLRIAMPKNPQPEKIRYVDMRTILQQLLEDLSKAELTLSTAKDAKVKLPLRFGQISLDFNCDGKADDDEKLWRIYQQLNRGLQFGPEFAAEHGEKFVIAFDTGDVAWLRGYCHLLSAICEMSLAYDQQLLFDALAPHIFPVTDAPAMPAELLPNDRNHWEAEIADAIAAIHLMRFPIKEPKRMAAAHAHLTQVIQLSRESWKAIQAETDNDHEWLPNPQQTGVIPNARVTVELINGWHEFLQEAELILKGEKLVPHWRFNEKHGINLKRVFHEPRDFDVVLWAHGVAAIPYTEKGPPTNNETWWRLQRLFGGEFMGFAFWFN